MQEREREREGEVEGEVEGRQSHKQASDSFPDPALSQGKICWFLLSPLSCDHVSVYAVS